MIYTNLPDTCTYFKGEIRENKKPCYEQLKLKRICAEPRWIVLPLDIFNTPACWMNFSGTKSFISLVFCWIWNVFVVVFLKFDLLALKGKKLCRISVTVQSLLSLDLWSPMLYGRAAGWASWLHPISMSDQ